jgi:hypothetical protein
MDGAAAGITADSVLIGGASAHAAITGKDDADTGGWTPGDTKAAEAAAEALGLAALLASFGSGSGDLPDVAGDMEDGYLNVVARVLAGWDPETAAAELGDMLETAVADGAYAEALTVTQITTVSGQAALSLYATQNGLLVQWVTDGEHPCPVCVRNSADDPRLPGIPFSSGDTSVPAHPNCRCAVLPAGAYVAGAEG